MRITAEIEPGLKVTVTIDQHHFSAGRKDLMISTELEASEQFQETRLGMPQCPARTFVGKLNESAMVDLLEEVSRASTACPALPSMSGHRLKVTETCACRMSLQHHQARML